MNSSKYNKSSSARVGDAGKGKAFSFAALSSESSSEDEATPSPVSLKQIIAADAILSAMFNGSGASWGDLDLLTAAQLASEAHTIANWRANEAAAEIAAKVALEGLWNQEGGIWEQPFSRKLEASSYDRYDFSGLSEEDYEACMSWLYANGWQVIGASRQGARAFPDDQPPRIWVSDRFAALLQETPVVAAQIKVQKPKSGSKVPRFCRSSAGGVPCPDAGCRYVHADTMPRLNKPCGFGAECGGSDPAKRASCIYMHPGETWTEELVVCRPVAAAACPCAH